MDFITRLFTGSEIEHVTPFEVQKKLNQKPKPYLLDVRQPEEYRSGHIPGAKLIPLGELGKRLHELPKTQEIICVCASGSRSQSATRQLAGAGYKVINMRGGMMAWSRVGLPVTKGK